MKLRNKIFEGKRCIITGATGGLGKQIAKEFAQAGCNLFLTGRSNEKLELLKNELKTENEGIEIFYCSSNLTKIESVTNLIENIREKFSSIDVLINCAGNFPVKSLSESTIEEYDSCMNLNVRAPFVLSKEFSKDMIKNEWGRIVNIASSGAYNGLKNTSIYRSSKHALLGLTRSLTNELKEFNVRTYCFSPGPMKTEMGKEIINKENHNEKFETFMQTNEIAEFLIFVISFENNLIAPEIRMGRMI
jgi:short-subunit dehydrogenase